MPIKVSEELRKTLAEPDSKGVVRARVALRVSGDTAEILEINDVPVTYLKEKENDENPLRSFRAPDLGPVEDSLYRQ